MSVRPDGTTWIRDPRTTPFWHNLSTLPGYPAGVRAVSTEMIIEVLLGFRPCTSRFRPTPVASTGRVCTVGLPIPLLGGFFAPGAPLGPPAYPANCTDWVNQTPPLRMAT